MTVSRFSDPRLETLLGALADPAAPTSVHHPGAARKVHVADSLVALELAEVRAAHRLVDLGSGAGLPGLVLAIALANAHVSLVESNRRKCTWMEQTAEQLGLENVRVIWARAEELEEEPFDVVTARAVAPLPVLCEYAAPMLVEGGALVAWKGAVDAQEEADGLHAAAELGLERAEVRAVEPYPGSERRTLYVFRKVAPTPARFPRRPGIATKRPLSAPDRRPRR